MPQTSTIVPHNHPHISSCNCLQFGASSYLCRDGYVGRWYLFVAHGPVVATFPFLVCLLFLPLPSLHNNFWFPWKSFLFTCNNNFTFTLFIILFWSCSSFSQTRGSWTLVHPVILHRSLMNAHLHVASTTYSVHSSMCTCASYCTGTRHAEVSRHIFFASMVT